VAEGRPVLKRVLAADPRPLGRTRDGARDIGGLGSHSIPLAHGMKNVKHTLLALLCALTAISCDRKTRVVSAPLTFQDGSPRLDEQNAALLVYKSFVDSQDYVDLENRRDWSVRLANSGWGDRSGVDPLVGHLVRMEELENILHDLEKTGRATSLQVAKAASFRAEAERWIRQGRHAE